MMFRKISYLNKKNSGNRSPRSEKQIYSAIHRMLLDNPMKKAVNQVRQSNRMVGNHLWKFRKKQLIKQQPSAQVGVSL